MRATFVSLITALAALVPLAGARATSDTGSSATLRALVGHPGQPARYAIFQHIHVQLSTFDCNTFTVVDLSAKQWNERAWSGPASTLEEQQTEADDSDPALIKAAVVKCLDGFGPELSKLEVQPLSSSDFVGIYENHPFAPPDETGALGDAPDADPRQARLKHLDFALELHAKGPSRIYTDHCSDERGDDGELLPEKERCELWFRGQSGTWRLRVKDRRTGAITIGTSRTVEPTDLLQVVMGLNLEGELEDVGVPTLDLMSLSAYETEHHILLFGSMAHAPTLNGTYIPVAAFVAKTPSPQDPAYASPRGCACEGGGGPPLVLGALVLFFLVTWARTRADKPHVAARP